MKITHLIYALHVGGAENIMIDMINVQIKLKHTVRLIIINNELNSSLLSRIHENVEVIKLKRPLGSKNPYYILKLYEILYFNRHDIVHCHTTSLGKLLKVYTGKTLLTVHDTIRDKKIASLASEYTSVISITNAVKDSLFEFSNIESDVVYNGVYTHQINSSRTTNVKYRILQLSRLHHEKKGQDILLNSLSKLVNENKIKNISCDFIGEGKSFEYLKKLVKDLDLENYVNFLGLKDREEVYDKLCTYDLLIQPSRYEGFGLTVAEAMAAKVPVLVSDIEGPMEVIQYGEYGTFFKSDNIESLTEKVLFCMENRNYKINEAYEFTQNNYDINETVKKYLDKY